MKKNFTFFLTFCFAKGIVFLAPLFLADILSKVDFGILEYSLAGIGLFLNAVVNLGIPGAYPYFTIRKKDISVKEGFYLHGLWLSLYFVINQIIYFSTDQYGLDIYLALNISFIVASQLFYSSQLKSHEKIHFAVLLDGGVYILLGVLLTGYFLKIVSMTIENINLIVLSYAVFFFIFGIINFLKSEKKQIFNKYKKIISFSIHLLISSVFLFLLTISGRVLAKLFFGYEEAGLYGFYFRLAAIVVMIYQIVSIRYFKDLYTIDHKKLDKYFSLFFIFIFITSLVLYFISPYIVPIFSNFFKETILKSNTLYFIIFCQMTMWIATALNSNIIDREGLAKTNNKYFILLFILVVLVLLIFKNKITLNILSFGIYTVFFITNLVQYFTLYKKKILFKKASIVLITIYTTSTVIILFIN